ncbi:hypothetical protein WJX84_007924 [Apatococcus fuscideae]|uniref:Uncharacterized protein n=1 Tax=Apatococcus fuscideae TaxID=2026836 RepID=A0AAW1T238_9CHLO
MDCTVDLNATWKDCERHVEEVTKLVREILNGDRGVQQAAPALLERLELLKSSCHLAKGQSDLLAQREKVAVRAMQTQAAASVSQMGQLPSSMRITQIAGRQQLVSGNQTYLQGVQHQPLLQSGSPQLQVLTPTTTNILLTGGALSGQVPMNAMQTTCTNMDGSQMSPSFQTMTTSQPVSYIVPTTALSSAHVTQLRPSQASSLNPVGATRVVQIQQQPQMNHSSHPGTLPGQMAFSGISNGAMNSGLAANVAFLPSPAAQNGFLSSTMAGRHGQAHHSASSTSPCIPPSAFAPPTTSIQDNSPTLTGSKRGAAPIDQLQAFKRVRDASSCQPGDGLTLGTTQDMRHRGPHSERAQPSS